MLYDAVHRCEALRLVVVSTVGVADVMIPEGYRRCALNDRISRGIRDQIERGDDTGLARQPLGEVIVVEELLRQDLQGDVAVQLGLATERSWVFSGLSSYGAPVPDEPRNNFVPSVNVMSLPFALFEPSFA